jgi:ATP-dependent Clp protease ATP-binding subunit ClpC
MSPQTDPLEKYLTMTFDEIVEDLRATTDPEAVPFAAESFALIAESGRSTVIERLRRLLRERHLTVRRGAVVALGMLKDKGAGPLLLPFLSARSGLLRRDALTTLAQIDNQSALPEIGRRLEDKKSFVRVAAAKALTAFGTPDSVDLLGRAIQCETEHNVRKEFLQSLANIGLDKGQPEKVVGLLLGHSVLEQDRTLRRRSILHADAITREMNRGSILAALRSVPETIRPTLARLLAEEIHSLGLPLKRMVSEMRAQPPERTVLSAYGSDLVLRAREGKEFRGCFGKDEIIDRITERLSRDGPRSILLVGKSGVGKTALVHELAIRLANAPVIVDPVLMEVTTGDILSGTRYLGEWQTRLRDFMKQFEAPRRAIWYLPDVNRLLDAGMTHKSNENFASMLSPFLERGSITIIGESTIEQFRRGIDREPSFRKHFLVIRVEESNVIETIDIMRSMSSHYIKEFERNFHRKLIVPAEVLERTSSLAENYFPTLARPGSGLSLLRETLEGLIEQHRARRDKTDLMPGPFGLPRRTPKRHQELSLDESGPLLIKDSHIIATLSSSTGVPELMLNDDMRLDLLSVSRFFSNRVLGQDAAVAVMTDLIALIKSDLTDPQKPLATLFFVGPTGVGKTEMAKALATFLFGSEDRLVRLDMADYQDYDSYRRLTGDPRSASSGASHGHLTAPVRDHPFSVILLDEIEKAHPNTYDLLLPVLDDGRLTDDRGQITDFRRTIIIMTSNIASDLSEGVQAGFGSDDRSAINAFEDKVLRTMKDFFRPEFLNRIDKNVVFRSLTLEIMRRIVGREVERVLERPGVARRNVVIDLDDSVIGLLMREGFSEQFGARPLKRRVESLILKPLARAFLELPSSRDSPSVLRLTTRANRVIAQVTAADSPEEDLTPSTEGRESERLSAVDPMIDGVKVSLEDLEERLIEYRDRVGDLIFYLENKGFATRKAALLEEAGKENFWAENGHARQVMSEINILEKLISAPKNLFKRLESLEDLLDRACRGGDRRRLLKTAASRSVEILQAIEFGEFAARCPNRKDRQDAYITLRRLGEHSHQMDLTKRLAHMYCEWAKRKGLHARTLLETADETRGLLEATLLVEGHCAYGLLAGESGLHQFTSRYEGLKRDVDFVRVDVIPEPMTIVKVRPEELWEEARKLKKAASVLYKKPKTHVLITHKVDRVTVAGNSARKRDDALKDGLAVLHARLAQAQSEGAVLGGIDTIEEAREKVNLVRKYQLFPQKFVRDVKTGIKGFDLESVLGGKIDDFIASRLSLGRGHWSLRETETQAE